MDIRGVDIIKTPTRIALLLCLILGFSVRGAEFAVDSAGRHLLLNNKPETFA